MTEAYQLTEATSFGRNKDASIGFFIGDGTDDSGDGNDLSVSESLKSVSTLSPIMYFRCSEKNALRTDRRMDRQSLI